MTEACVFVNYRRQDAPGSAGRLADDLADRFGELTVFRDVQMRPGIDFVDEITRAAGSCHVLLAVIGPRWATIAGPDGTPRLQDPGDFVRLEIETALARPDVVVIPVLVEDAVMPAPAELPPSLREIARLNASRLSDASWDYDIARLGDAIAPILRADPAPVRGADGEHRDDPEPEDDPAGHWSVAGKLAGASLVAGPVGLVLSEAMTDQPVAAGANTIPDLTDAGERVAFYALERGITWAVVGAVILGTWVALTHNGRPLAGTALTGAWVGAVGGVLAGFAYQGAKYLNNPLVDVQASVPMGVTSRAAGYALAAGLIGWALARTARCLTRLEGAAVGALAGIVAAKVTAETAAAPRGLSLGLEAVIVGGALAFAAVAAHRARAGGATVRLELPLTAPRGVDVG